MFTGIVEATGEVLKAEDGTLWVEASMLSDAPIGASVAVDGVCLTVTALDAAVCRFDISEETLSRTTLGSKRAGDRVNVERPLRVGDELGGHIVQGHVDAVGVVEWVRAQGEGRRIRLSAPASLLHYIIEKGSVTVDGVSLTVAAVDEDGFEIALIPHTLAVTTLGRKEASDAVNLEVDVLAKYTEKLVAPWGPNPEEPPRRTAGGS